MMPTLLSNFGSPSASVSLMHNLQRGEAIHCYFIAYLLYQTEDLHVYLYHVENKVMDLPTPNLQTNQFYQKQGWHKCSHLTVNPMPEQVAAHGS